MSNKAFLTHIEAFRGVAILLVLLYHINSSFCSNGYYGVDAFLVISGYFLIGGLLKNNSDDFKIGEFINRKVLRIIPPLLVTVLVFLPLGLFFMPPSEITKSAITALTALFGYSNVYLDSSSQGYFGNETVTNLFVHTWYLSVILQIYLIFAFLIWTVKKRSKTVKWYIIFGVCGAAVLWIVYNKISLWIRPFGDAPSIYYWTWARIVEVIVGASVLLLPKSKNKILNNLVMIGALIGFLLVGFDNSKHHLLALLCSAAILWCIPQGKGAKILDNKFFRFLGKYSYSIYLTHWPLIVCFHYANYSESLLLYFLLFLTCLIIGGIAYHAVEIRRWKLAWIGVVWLVCVTMTFALWKTNGLKDYLSTAVIVDSHDKIDGYVQEAYVPDYPGNVLNYWEDLNIEGIVDSSSVSKEHLLYRLGTGNQKPSFVMVGDSHASAFVAGMAEVANQLQRTGYYVPSYVTPFWDIMCGRDWFCFSGAEAEVFLSWLRKHPEIQHVVMVQRWSIRLRETITNDEMMPLAYDGSYRHPQNAFFANVLALKQFCEQIKKIGKNVILMTEVPSVRVSPPPYLRRQLMNQQEIDMSLLTRTLDSYIESHRSHLHVFNEMEAASLCKVIYAHWYMFDNGEFKAYDGKTSLMMDDDHLSISGALYFARKSMSSWRRAFQK